MREAANRAASVNERRRERVHAVADAWRDRRWQVHTDTQEIIERFVANALAATDRVMNDQATLEDLQVLDEGYRELHTALSSVALVGSERPVAALHALLAEALVLQLELRDQNSEHAVSTMLGMTEVRNRWLSAVRDELGTTAGLMPDDV